MPDPKIKFEKKIKAIKGTIGPKIIEKKTKGTKYA